MIEIDGIKTRASIQEESCGSRPRVEKQRVAVSMQATVLSQAAARQRRLSGPISHNSRFRTSADISIRMAKANTMFLVVLKLGHSSLGRVVGVVEASASQLGEAVRCFSNHWPQRQKIVPCSVT